MQKSEHQQRVEQFMELAGQPIPAGPCPPDAKTAILRARLVLEEALELVVALGLRPVHEGRRLFYDQIQLFPTTEPDLIGIADGCADVSVVTIGTLSACGIADKPILEAVDANNLAKFGPGSRVDEHGKLIKPPGHKPPDLFSLLFAPPVGD